MRLGVNSKDNIKGFIGIGTMGFPIAMALANSGVNLLCYDRDKRKSEVLSSKKSITIASGLADFSSCKTIYLSLPGPKEVEDTVTQLCQLNLDENSVIIDLSTNDVATVQRMHQLMQNKNLVYVDSPLSGGKKAAEKCSLTVMISGNENAIASHRKEIGTFASKIFMFDSVGSATIIKLINNQIFLTTSVILQEAMKTAEKSNLNRDQVLEVLKASSAGPVTKLASLVLAENTKQDIFSLNIAHKDLKLALELAKGDSNMRLTEAALEVYQTAIESGYGDHDFFATRKIL